MSVEISITDQIVEINEVSNPVEISVSAGAAVAQWGNITGTLSNQTDLQNALNLKVPYTGATANVDLGEYELKAGQIEYDQTPTGTAGVAVTRWNDSTGTIETTLKGGSVVLEHGRDMFERVVNKTGIQLTKAAYQAVRVSNAQGQRLAVQLAQANNDNNSADTIGLVVETIDNNQEGYIYTVGEIDGVNTTGTLQGETWVDGDVLYLSPTTAGRITNVKPIAPQHLVIIGYVIYAHQNNGKIYVKVMNGWELGELHDVNTTGAVAGNVLKYNGTIWTPSGDVGITSLNGLTATTQTFSLDTRGNDVAIVSSGSNHEFIFPSASATRRGVLTSADWSLFFNKIGGSGTIGTMPIFTGTGAIGNSILNITNGLVNIDGVGNLSDYALQIGTGRTNNGFAYIDLVGDAFYSDYGFRLMRNNTGQNATSVLEHRGTGDFIFKTVDNANLYLQTGSTNRVFVEANSGALNVANTSAVFLANTGEQLIVNGSAKFASSVTANSLVKSGGTSSQYLMADGSTSTLTNPVTGTGVSGQVAYWSGTNTQTGSNNLFWDNTNARLGIGTNAPASSLQIASAGTLATGIQFNNAGSIGSVFGDGNIMIMRSGATHGIAIVRTTTGLEQANTSIGGFRIELQSLTNTPLYTYFADSDTGIGRAAADTLTFFAGGERARITALGNLHIGTFVSDAGQRLQVIGDTLLKGSGNTSATTALTVQNSDGTNMLRVRNDGAILYGIGAYIAPIAVSTGGINPSGQGLVFYQNDGSSVGRSFLYSGASIVTTSGVRNNIQVLQTFAPTSGTAVFNNLVLEQTINQTGGANGITRGLYVNPTLTAAADWRSIEWSNNTGWGLYGAGTSDNFIAGKLGIGSTTLTANSLRISRAQTGATSLNTVLSSGQINSDVTASVNNFASQLITQAATFTLGQFSHFRASDTLQGAGSTITNNVGFRVDDLTFGTNDYGFYGDLSSGANKWNLYMNGTANNYLNGNLLLGSTTPTGEKLQVTGTMKVTGAITGTSATFTSNLSTINIGSNDTADKYLTVKSSSGDFYFGNTGSIHYVYGTGTKDLVFYTNSIQRLLIGGSTGAAVFSSSVAAASYTVNDAGNIAVGTTTGTKIGTATSQKIGFWNATPIVQPTTAIAEATFVENSGGTAVNVDSTFAGYTLQQIAQALKNMGILA